MELRIGKLEGSKKDKTTGLDNRLRNGRYKSGNISAISDSKLLTSSQYYTVLTKSDKNTKKNMEKEAEIPGLYSPKHNCAVGAIINRNRVNVIINKDIRVLK